MSQTDAFATTLLAVRQYEVAVIREASRIRAEVPVSQPAQLARLVWQLCGESDRERFYVLLLNNANKVTGIHEASVGGVASSIVDLRIIFRVALLGGAAAIAVAHNHPSGNLEPSREDVAITRQLKEAGALLQIPVLDHIIVGDSPDEFTSLGERGLI